MTIKEKVFKFVKTEFNEDVKTMVRNTGKINNEGKLIIEVGDSFLDLRDEEKANYILWHEFLQFTAIKS